MRIPRLVVLCAILVYLILVVFPFGICVYGRPIKPADSMCFLIAFLLRFNCQLDLNAKELEAKLRDITTKIAAMEANKEKSMDAIRVKLQTVEDIIMRLREQQVELLDSKYQSEAKIKKVRLVIAFAIESAAVISRLIINTLVFLVGMHLTTFDV